MKILLLAMSGIRACDPELLKLGLTLPGFVERSQTIARLPSLGLLTLAGMTPDEHTLLYRDVPDSSQLHTLPQDVDLVAISSFSAQIKEAYAIARSYSSRGIPVVIGGLHTTTLPHEAVAAGASAVVGEGECVWHQILHDANLGRMRPIYDAKTHKAGFNLADAPMPAFHLLDMSRYNRITVQTSRGCPWQCSFCASSILLTKLYKQKPLDRVLREIDVIRDRWPRPFIEFADDNSFINRAYWRELLPQLATRKIRWFTETDLSIADDPALLSLMARAGCKEVLIGFESPTQTGLHGLEMHANWKFKQWPRYRQTIDTIQSHGIRVNACFVLGLDGHTPDTFNHVYDFVQQATPFDVQITYQTPFPGTPLYATLKAQNRLTHDGQWERCTLFDINYTPNPMTAQELRTGFFDLATRLYSDTFTQWRRSEFRRKRQSTGAA
jgi:radical SAM superfamily enzyme YgiQ (UPF0313 family)